MFEFSPFSSLILNLAGSAFINPQIFSIFKLGSGSESIMDFHPALEKEGSCTNIWLINIIFFFNLNFFTDKKAFDLKGEEKTFKP
mgnify:CR=1 FL=1